MLRFYAKSLRKYVEERSIDLIEEEYRNDIRNILDSLITGLDSDSDTVSDVTVSLITDDSISFTSVN